MTLLRAHIQKEDFVLYPMGKRALDDGDIEALRLRFAEVDPSGDAHRRYGALDDELLTQATNAA